MQVTRVVQLQKVTVLEITVNVLGELSPYTFFNPMVKRVSDYDNSIPRNAANSRHELEANSFFSWYR